MKVPFYLLLLICSYFTACTDNEKKQVPNNKSEDLPVDAALQHVASNTGESDTVTIDRKRAIFYLPDRARLDSLFLANGESEMWTGVGDYLFYLNESAEYLKPFLPIKEVDSRKYLKFVAANNKITFLKLDTLAEYWGVILFDPAKAPKQVDITAIEEEYKAYFK